MDAVRATTTRVMREIDCKDCLAGTNALYAVGLLLHRACHGRHVMLHEESIQHDEG
jgi:hypothetical protein